jgi:hypothetical protein
VGRRDEVLCEQLKELATKLGITVREEVLLREAGYRVRSGLCRVRGQDVFFLDRHARAEEKLDVLVRELARRDLEAVYVSPELRRLLERRARAAA